MEFPQLWVHFNVEFKGLSCKRQNETVTQDGNSRTLQQETSANSPATKKKIKLEKDIDEQKKGERTRNLDRGMVGINYIQQQNSSIVFIFKYYLKVFVQSFV